MSLFKNSHKFLSDIFAVRLDSLRFFPVRFAKNDRSVSFGPFPVRFLRFWTYVLHVYLRTRSLHTTTLFYGLGLFVGGFVCLLAAGLVKIPHDRIFVKLLKIRPCDEKQ